MPVVKPGVENVTNIKVIGVGGGGGSALHRMIESKIKGVEFVAVNTDAQALHYSNAPIKLPIGQTLTRGLGAGMNPSIGQQAAEESREEIYEVLKGSDMVFVTGCFGGGTASGALPVICEVGREAGCLTLAIVTKPFSFEGQQRMTIAEESLAELQDRVDASVVVPNDRLLQIIDKKTSLLDAFRVADDVLRQGVQGITDLITHYGMVNVDFADVRAIVENAGSALMGIGRATGENRAVEAARAAVDSPLLDIDIKGAKGVIFNVTAGADVKMFEVEEAARVITEQVDPNAKVIFGTVIDEDAVEDGELKITVVATGFDKPEPAPRRSERYGGASQQYGGQPAPQFTPTQPTNQPAQYGGGGQAWQYGRTENAPPAYQAPPMPSGQKSNEQDSGDDNEDLEVPTFIRRKMREQRENRRQGGE